LLSYSREKIETKKCSTTVLLISIKTKKPKYRNTEESNTKKLIMRMVVSVRKDNGLTALTKFLLTIIKHVNLAWQLTQQHKLSREQLQQEITGGTDVEITATTKYAAKSTFLG
jgi:hypothetical protein